MIKSIILLSGGMDSLVTAAIANKESDEIYFLHCNYKQKTELKEKQVFEELCEFYQPKKSLSVDISYLAEIGGTSLIDETMDLDLTGKNSQEVPSSYVPFRNAHLIAIAVSWAEVIGANRIYIGAVEEDSSGYPDCRKSFYKSYNKTIDLGTKDETKIEIHTPIIYLTKDEIIKKGISLGAPLEKSWSCYKNNDVACGLCDSCRLRISAFKRANEIDKIPYEIDIDWTKK